MVRNNKKIARHLKKINALLKKYSREYPNSFLKNCQALTLLIYILEYEQKTTSNDVVTKLAGAQLIEEYYDFISNDVLNKSIDEHRKDLLFWNEQLNHSLHPLVNKFNPEIHNLFKQTKITSEQFDLLFLHILDIFIVDCYIQRFHKKIDDNISDPNYELNTKLVKYQLDHIRDAQLLLMKIFPKDFNNTCVAINLLIKKHY